jgi:hypothetical protein
MHNHKLPYSLSPSNNESAQGFIARLALENCCVNTKDLLNVMSHHNVKNPNFLRIGSWKSITACFEILSEVDELQTNEFFKQQEKQYKLTPLIRNKARCCPVCLSHEQIQKFEWLITIKTHCSEHQMPLIDRCQCCDVPLCFDAIQSNRCDHCSSKISHSTIEKVELPSYLIDLIGLKGRELKEKSKELYKAAGRLLRPFDILAGKSEYLEKIENKTLIELFTAAAELIRSPNARDYYAAEITDHYEQAKTLNKHIPLCIASEFKGQKIEQKTEQCNSKSFIQWKTESAIPDKVKTVLKSQERENNHELTKYLVDLWMANKILGTTCSELESFVVEGIINPIKSSKSLQGTLFDIRDFAQLLEIQPTLPIGMKPTTLNELRESQFFERYSVSLGELVSSPSIQNYNLEKNDGMNSLCWNEKELFPWAISTFKNKDIQVSPKTVKLILNVTQTELNNLVDQGKLTRCLPDRQKKKLFSSYKSTEVQTLL